MNVTRTSKAKKGELTGILGENQEEEKKLLADREKRLRKSKINY